MKGKIAVIVPKEWNTLNKQTGAPETRKFCEFTIEGDPRVFTNWQPQITGAMKPGDEIEFEAVQTGKGWKATVATPKQGVGFGGRGMSPEYIALERMKQKQMVCTMSASYAKDLLVKEMELYSTGGAPLGFEVQVKMFSQYANTIHAWITEKMKGE